MEQSYTVLNQVRLQAVHKFLERILQEFDSLWPRNHSQLEWYLSCKYKIHQMDKFRHLVNNGRLHWSGIHTSQSHWGQSHNQKDSSHYRYLHKISSNHFQSILRCNRRQHSCPLQHNDHSQNNFHHAQGMGSNYTADLSNHLHRYTLLLGVSRVVVHRLIDLCRDIERNSVHVRHIALHHKYPWSSLHHRNLPYTYTGTWNNHSRRYLLNSPPSKDQGIQ